MNIKTLAIVVVSTFFVTGAYSAEVNFTRTSPWEVIIYSPLTNNDNNIGQADNATGTYYPVVGFKRISPWEVIITRNTDRKVEVVKRTHAENYQGFQPVMYSHYPRFDFNHDGVLTMEECLNGMNQLKNS